MYGKRIKDLRIENNLNQSELAEMLHVSQSAVAKYENEQLEPNINMLEKIADVFICSVDYLLGRESEEGVIVIDGNSSQTEREQTLIKSFRKLPLHKQEKVIGYIAGIKEE
ncbi:MAG: helix-turn-helix domain-containing protein [Clostridia bacterium]|nr:helix-turn-helix domain-containing protein [Clostridia bacterium]